MRSRAKVIMLLILFALICGCSSNEQKLQLTTQYGSVPALQAHLEKDKMAWWSYHKKHIILSTEFSALDTDDQSIDKKTFIEKLHSGDFIALEVKDQEEKGYYLLRAITENAADGISDMVKVDAFVALEHFLQEGKDFPDFDFTDLQGNNFTKQDLTGKTIFLKTWFIACAPCIAEMPDLNKMVEEYQNRDDVIFISLALDKPEALKKFLDERQFDYKVVARQGDFINEKMVNIAYPTHYIIGPDGKVKKVTSNFEELGLARKAMGI